MTFHVEVPAMPEYCILISPNARAIAYVASSARANYLFIREMGSVAPRKIDGTEGADHPFWSPDSRSIAFFAGGRLKKVDISGGPPRDLCEAPTGVGGAWSHNGVILFSDLPVLSRVPAEGGKPIKITALDQYDVTPDGQRFLLLKLPAKATLAPITVTLNWTSLLKK